MLTIGNLSNQFKRYHKKHLIKLKYASKKSLDYGDFKSEGRLRCQACWPGDRWLRWWIFDGDLIHVVVSLSFFLLTALIFVDSTTIVTALLADCIDSCYSGLQQVIPWGLYILILKLSPGFLAHTGNVRVYVLSPEAE